MERKAPRGRCPTGLRGESSAATRGVLKVETGHEACPISTVRASTADCASTTEGASTASIAASSDSAASAQQTTTNC